jgi:hypothetical protein
LETENFELAIKDYKEAFKHLSEEEEENFRTLAGIHFNLALSLEFSENIEESKKYLELSRQFLIKKENLFNSENLEELKEIKGLIEEISLKINDINNNSSNLPSLNQAIQDATFNAAKSLAESFTSSNGGVNDLTGMVRKRKPEQENESEDFKGKKGNLENDSETKENKVIKQ